MMQCFPYIDLFVAARHNINIDRHIGPIDFIFSNYLKWVKSYLFVELRAAHQPLPPLSLCLALFRTRLWIAPPLCE